MTTREQIIAAAKLSEIVSANYRYDSTDEADWIDIENFYNIAFEAGRASRDAEVALLKADNEYLYIAAIERDQLREQVTLLRDVLSDFDKAAINSKSIIGFAGQSFKLITKMRKALAATEPERNQNDN